MSWPFHPLLPAAGLLGQSAPVVTLNSPANAATTTDTTPDLDFTGADENGDDITYQIQINDKAFGDSSPATYYFDGSDGVSDPDANWTSDTNAYDGSTATNASGGQSTTSTGYLHIQGTNAADNGGNITMVRARIYGTVTSNNVFGTIYTDGLAETLGEPSNSSGALGGWGSWVQLSAPSGGWTWSKIQALEVKLWVQDAGTEQVARVELEVTFSYLIDKTSDVDSGFVNPDVGGDLDPFVNGDNVRFTPQGLDTITLDAVSTGRNSSGDITVSHTTGSGEGTVLFALLTVQDSNHANYPARTITYGGLNLTKIRRDEAVGNVGTEIWCLVDPPVGTYNCVADLTGTLGETTLGVVTLFGAKQALPEANNGATGNSSSPSLSLTTLTDNAWSLTVAAAEATFSAVNNSQTALSGYPLTDQSYENAHAARRQITTAGATTLGYSLSSGQAWSISAVSVAPANDTLVVGNTYYWRVRGKDPTGSGSFGSWSASRSFTVTSPGSGPVWRKQVVAT